MELDQLKDPWRQLGDTPPPRMDLADLLRKAEKSAVRPLRRMKRVVISQAVSLVAVYILAFSQFQGTQRVAVGWFYLLMVGTAAIYYVRKYRLLRQMERIRPDEDMVTNFTVKLRRFKQLLMLERWIACVLMMIVMWFVCWLLWDTQRQNFYRFLGIHFHPGQEAWVILGWTVCGIALSWPAQLITRWTNRWRYGAHIGELEKTLEELRQ